MNAGILLVTLIVVVVIGMEMDSRHTDRVAEIREWFDFESKA